MSDGKEESKKNLDDTDMSGLLALQEMKDSEPTREDLKNELEALRKKNEDLTKECEQLRPLQKKNKELMKECNKLRPLQAENKALKKAARENEKKRKAAEKEEAAQNKKQKISDNEKDEEKVEVKDVTINMQVHQRKDVPKDVVELTKLLRSEIRSVKRTTARRIEKLEQELALAQMTPEERERQKKDASSKPSPRLSYEEQLKLNRAKAAENATASGVPAVVTFEDRLKELEVFIKGNGHARVPHVRVPSDKRGLSRWVFNIRRSYKEKMESLSPEELKNRVCYSATDLNTDRITKLESMGFLWRVAPKATPWETRIQQLQAHKAEHGTLGNIQRNHPVLGEVVHTLRKQYRDNTLPTERLQQLTELGFVFETGNTKTTFEERLDQCRNFRVKHGHLNVPFPARGKGIKKADQPDPEDHAFRRWAVMIRDEWRKYQQGLKSRIDKKRITVLTGLGFVWDPMAPPPAPNPPPKDTLKPRPIDPEDKKGMPEAQKWEANIAMLRYVCARHGTIANYKHIQKEFPAEYTELRNWLMVQRKKYRSNAAGEKTTLTPERQQRLYDIGFNFDPTGSTRPGSSENDATGALATNTITDTTAAAAAGEASFLGGNNTFNMGPQGDGGDSMDSELRYTQYQSPTRLAHSNTTREPFWTT